MGILSFKKRLEQIHGAVKLRNEQVILSLLEQDNACRFLDLGCGNGKFTRELGERIGTKNFYGLELVAESAQQAEQRGVEVYVADLNEPLPLDSASFDVVHAKEILEHLYHTDLFLKEIYRVLVRGGYAIVCVPNLAAWHNIFSLILGYQPFPATVSDEIILGNPLGVRYKVSRAGIKSPLHLRIPTYRGLKELFQYHGFKVEKIVGSGYYPFWGIVARVASRLDPRHSAYLTVKARKK